MDHTINQITITLLLAIFGTPFVYSEPAHENLSFENSNLPPKIKEWTIMAYLNGHSNLERRNIEKIVEMEKVGSSDEVNIVAELGKMKSYSYSLGNDKWSGARRYYLINDGNDYQFSSPIIQKFENADMGDWEHLADFIIWAKSNYPAKKYMLIVSGHGSSWQSIGKPIKKGMLYDDVSDNHITTIEMRKVFEKAGNVDILFMDSCEMQDIAVVYEIRKHVQIIVGSQNVIQATGIIYEPVLRNLTKNPYVNIEDAAKLMVFIIPGSDFGHAVFTLSAIRTSELEALIGFLNNFAEEVINSQDFTSIIEAREKTQKMDYTWSKDLGDFLRLVSETTSNQLVKNKALAALEHLQNNLIIVKTSLYPTQTGISIYLPSKKFNKSFCKLLFAEDTIWDEFIRSLLKQDL